MTGLVRTAAIVACLGVLAASIAAAGVPSPSNSIKPNFIATVGRNPGNATPNFGDPGGTFTVTVRDVGNFPIPNSQVIVDLGACTDAKLCPSVYPGQTADCPTKTVRGFTDGTGSITFTIIGAGTNSGGSPGPGAGCANITADGVSLIHPTNVVYDQNGAAAIPVVGMEVTDLSKFLIDLGTGFYFGRSDYSALDGVDQGVISVIDLSKFLVRLGTGQSANGCSVAICP
jgi:hypothetical protein